MHRIGLLAALAGLFLATGAEATPITRTYTVTSQDYSFGINHLGPAPTDPVNASVTITFDPTVNVTGQTTGITLNSINRPLDIGSPIAFDFDTGSDRLTFGLLEDGAGAVSNGTTNDFTNWILNPEGAAPTMPFAAYSDIATNDFYEASLGKVGLTAPAAVPEPGSLALLLSALAGCAFIVRRRKPLAQA